MFTCATNIFLKKQKIQHSDIRKTIYYCKVFTECFLTNIVTLLKTKGNVLSLCLIITMPNNIQHKINKNNVSPRNSHSMSYHSHSNRNH